MVTQTKTQFLGCGEEKIPYYHHSWCKWMELLLGESEHGDRRRLPEHYIQPAEGGDVYG